MYGTGTTTTPVWGTAAGCTACHSVAIAATGPATGSHAKHNVTDCTQCHAAGTTSTSVPGTGHADGNIDVTDGYPANVTKHASGTYTGTCSTASCHANVYGTGTTTTPVWGTAAGCSACHSVAIAATGPATGSHAKHNVTDCTQCHAAGTTATSVPGTGHADGNIDVTDGYPANVAKHASGTYTGTCSTASCHANVYGTGTTTTPVWGTAAGCSACHSVAIAATGPATGSHAKHNVTDCTQCHAAGTTATSVPGTGHADGNIDVTDGYPANVTKHASGTYTGTCSTASCHANVYGTGTTTTPVWGTAAGCTACHSVAIAATGPATGSHAKHNVTDCTQCHAAGTTSTSVPGTGHADGNIDVTDGYPANVTKHASGTYTGSCSAAVCHQTGTQVAVGGTAYVASPVWGTASSCGICHGFPPAYANNTPKKNSHGAGGHSISCDNCHYNTTTNGTTVTTVANHTNGVYNVNPNTSKGIAFTYTYNAGGGSCASVSCHGTAQWGVTVMDCVSCHTSAVNITHGPLTGQTRRPIQPEFTQTWSHKESGGRTVVKEDCIVCHMEGNKATGGTSSLHADGFINLRDADTGVEITNVSWNGGTPGGFVTAAGNASFARFSRNLGVTLESDPSFLTIAAIEVNHCLKCHDSNGATSTEAQVPTTGTAGRPFGVAVGATSTQAYTVAAGNTTSNVVNVASSFDTTNASYHPVLGKQNNGFAGGSMMKAPWNGTLSPAKPGTGSTTAFGFLISCWDCHADATDAWGNTTVQTSTVTAHGDNVTLRANFGIAYPNLCTVCHANNYGTGTSGHGTGSAAATTSSNIGNNHATCNNCHSSGSAYNYRPWRAVDSHGFNVFAQVRSNTTGAAASATTWTSGAKPWAFIRTNNLSGWRPARGTGLTDAGNGTCGPNGVSPCSNSHGSYTPGGWY